jgi:radical SAM protein with 4Fe4S-binding SPASM domain
MKRNHNDIRGRSDCFSQLELFIARLNRTDKHITAVTTLTKTNIGDIERLYEYLAVRNVKIWQLQICSPFGNAKDNIGIAPRRADINRILQIYRKMKQKPMAVQLADNIGYYVNDASGDMQCEFRGCGAGIISVGIDSDGNVRGCESLKDDRFIEGNLRTRALSDIWNSADSFSYNRKFSSRLLTGNCADCEYGGVCAGGCRSHNLFAHNKLYESAVCAR